MIAHKTIDAIPPQDLWTILEEYNLLSASIRNNPGIISQMSQNGRFRVLHDGDEPLALLIEFRNQEPGVIDLLTIPQDRGLGKRRAEIADMAREFRAEWFDSFGLRRVQAYVPASRVNVQRFLRGLGFVEETRRGMGLRSAVSFGKAPEAVLIYGLLPSDPIREYRGEEEKAEIA